MTQRQFRPVIVVDQCPAWDEDKWAELRIGDAQLQCFKPCHRCVSTTVNPETGVKNPDLQPLKKLREFRLAPEGKMRQRFKESPLFGVNAGANVELLCRLLRSVGDAELKLKLAEKYRVSEIVIEALVTQRDRLKLSQYSRTLLPHTPEAYKALAALQNMSTKWKI